MQTYNRSGKGQILLFLALLIPVAVFSQQRQYEKIRNLNNIVLYQDFVKKYPTSEFTSEIKDKLELLEFDEAVKNNTPQAFSCFLKTYPDSRFISKANAKRDSLQIHLNWLTACKADTKEAYLSFLANNPGASASLLDQAQLFLKKTTIGGDWQAEKVKQDVASMKQFLENYDCIRSEPEYDSCYQNLSEIIWKETVLRNTLDSYKDFCNNWSGSGYIGLAAEALERFESDPLISRLRNDIKEQAEKDGAKHNISIVPYIVETSVSPHYVIKSNDRTYSVVNILKSDTSLKQYDNKFFTDLPVIAFMKPEEVVVVVLPFDLLLDESKTREVFTETWVSVSRRLGYTPSSANLRITSGLPDVSCYKKEENIGIQELLIRFKYDCAFIELCLSDNYGHSESEKVCALKTIEFTRNSYFSSLVKKYLVSDNQKIRNAAISACCALNPSDREVLESLFRSGFDDKLLALELVIRYSMPGYQDYLSVIIQDADDTLKKYAVRSLLRINNESARALLKENYQTAKVEIIESLYDEFTSESAFEMLLSLGEAAIPDYYLKLKENSKDKAIADLLKRNGKKSTSYLVSLLSEQGINKGDIISIIGETKDTTATRSILPFLSGTNESIKKATVGALAMMKDVRCLKDILYLAESETSLDVLKEVLDLQSGYIETRVIEKDENAVSTLKVLLKNWDLGSDAHRLLSYSDWKPVTFEDSVYSCLSRRSRDLIYTKQEEANAVLIKDIESSKRYVVENAIYSLISMGQHDILPQLDNILMTRGTKVLAEIYLNSGSEDLERYAKTWAVKHGYSINSGSGAYKARWGSIR